MHLKKNSPKGIAINKMPIRKASELFGIVNLVFFSPEDLNIIKNGPAERRRFMDLELSQLDKVYLSNLANYNRIVNQRNRLLKEPISENLSGYTGNMGDADGTIWRKDDCQRRKRIYRAGQWDHCKDSPETDRRQRKQIGLSYEPGCGALSLEAALEKNRESDIRMKSTSVGPHRDDICFMAGGIDIRNSDRRGSRGQRHFR